MKQVFLLILTTVFSVNLILVQDNKSVELTLNQNPEKAEIMISDIALFLASLRYCEAGKQFDPLPRRIFQEGQRWLAGIFAQQNRQLMQFGYRFYVRAGYSEHPKRFIKIL